MSMEYTTVYTKVESLPRMTIAKLFMNGRSQAVRLPAEFRFEGTAVQIRRDPVTGEVILSPKVQTLDAFIAVRDQLKAQAVHEFESFDLQRDAAPAPERNLA